VRLVVCPEQYAFALWSEDLHVPSYVAWHIRYDVWLDVPGASLVPQLGSRLLTSGPAAFDTTRIE